MSLEVQAVLEEVVPGISGEKRCYACIYGRGAALRSVSMLAAWILHGSSDVPI